MRNLDFSHIRTLDDVKLQKETLQRSIDLQEHRLQADVKRIRSSWSFGPHLLSSISDWVSMASPSLRLFFVGYQIARKFFKRTK